MARVGDPHRHDELLKRESEIRESPRCLLVSLRPMGTVHGHITVATARKRNAVKGHSPQYGRYGPKIKGSGGGSGEGSRQISVTA